MSTHLDVMSTPVRSRKSERVYRSPSHVNEPSPFSKVNSRMDIDAEDEEAGTILLALAQHAERILNHPHHLEKSVNSTMSIRNLLDNESSTSNIPQSSYSTSKPFCDSRRHSQQKKGFQICLTQRHQQPNKQDNSRCHHKTSFRHPSKVQKPTLPQTKTCLKRNSTHIRISYRIHAHRASMTTNKYEYASSAFRPTTDHRWKEKSFYHYQQQQNV